jgi:type IV pilus assembly protein PilQ
MKMTGVKIQTGMILTGLLLGLCVPAIADDTTQPDWQRPELLSPVQQRMRQEVSIDFRETPIEDVLMIMSKQADVDIIKSPKVEGTVTATLTDIPLSEALNNILEAHGYTYIATENMIRVIPREDVMQVVEKINSKVYRVTYADVKDVELALSKFISDRGSISSSPSTSNIIVTDTASKMEAIDQFMDEIDRVTPQILVEAKIYDISSTDSMDLGVEWQAGTNTGYLSGTEVFQNGAPLTGSIGNAYQPSVTDPFTSGAFSGKTSKTDTIGLLRYGIINDHINIDVALHASQEDIRAKLLANPRLMVLDNQEALIKIIEEIPYQELTQTSAGGSIGTTAFREVGVELRVTPHLTRDGLIRLALNPKFSVRTGDVQIQGTNGVSPQPVVATREESTTALVKDQQTVVIGGLKKQEISQQVNKIPLLGDLPLLGGLFRFEGESTVNSELVIFITPTVIIEPRLTDEEAQHLANTVFTSPRVPEPKIVKPED